MHTSYLIDNGWELRVMVFLSCSLVVAVNWLRVAQFQKKLLNRFEKFVLIRNEIRLQLLSPCIALFI